MNRWEGEQSLRTDRQCSHLVSSTKVLPQERWRQLHSYQVYATAVVRNDIAPVLHSIGARLDLVVLLHYIGVRQPK